jgi:hypothetical protein
MANISPVKAIKIKDVVGNPKGAINHAIRSGKVTTDKDGVADVGQVLVLGYFYGFATKAEQHVRMIPQPDGEAKREEWPCIRGDFECINLEGYGHRADKAFLAEHLCKAIGTACVEAQKDDPAARVQLAFEVQAVTSNKGQAGFEWRMVPKTELVPQNDPVAQLRAAAQGEGNAQLPAPEKVEDGGNGEPVDNEGKLAEKPAGKRR